MALTPSNLLYTTGFRSYFVAEWWRLHGTVLAFIPAADSLPVTLMLGDFEENTARAAAPNVELLTYRLWVDLSTAEQMALPGRGAEPRRPEQWDERELDLRTAEALYALGMTSGRIGTDLPHLNLTTWERLRREAPNVRQEHH